MPTLKSGFAQILSSLSKHVPLSVADYARYMARYALLRLQAARSRPFTAWEISASAIVVAPHPDDEVLGCGGVVALKRSHGALVNLVFMTDGAASHGTFVDHQELRLQRQVESKNAARVLNVPEAHLHYFDYPDGHLATCERTASTRLEALIKAQGATQIFIPIQHQEHPDHAAASRIGHTVAQSLGVSQPLAIFEYPIWFMRHWPWVSCAGEVAQELFENSVTARFGLTYLTMFNRHVDIHGVLDRKHAALEAHISQMQHRNDDPRWTTLGDVCRGDFLAAFFNRHEVFHQVR